MNPKQTDAAGVNELPAVLEDLLTGSELALLRSIVAAARAEGFAEAKDAALSALAKERADWVPGYDGIQHALRLAEEAIRQVQPQGAPSQAKGTDHDDP